MKKTLIKKVRIFDAQNQEISNETDVLFDSNKILEISPDINHDNAEIINAKNQILSPSFIDLRASCGEPGEEWKETFESLSSAALRGGYSHVLLMPDNRPAISTASQVKYILERTKNLPLNFLPTATVTVDSAGEKLTDIHDLNKFGVNVFTDGKVSIRNLRLLMIAQQYASDFNGKIFHFAHDKTFNTPSFVNESLSSLRSGMKGMPNVSESSVIARDLELIRYTNLPLHFCGVSTKESVNLLRSAKKEGLNFTSDVHVNNLYFDDEELSSFDSNFKVNPPLRTKEDVVALKNAINDGIIDAIVSDHRPQNIELKNVEFDFATEGTITIEHSFLMAYNALKDFCSIEKILTAFTFSPAKILNIKNHHIAKGNNSNLVLIDTDDETIPGKEKFKSISSNSPFNGMVSLKGKIVKTFTSK